MTLHMNGRYAEAEAEERAVAEARSVLRLDTYAPLAPSVAALAMCAHGHHKEALAAYDELLPVFGRTFGAEHPPKLKLRSGHAQTLGGVRCRRPDRRQECRVADATHSGGRPQRTRWAVPPPRRPWSPTTGSPRASTWTAT